ncbi:MAG: type II toxin-antitoxin system HicB family antitoxin [Dehalococcoidia bacterium]|nr:type II toxin-antitoxin system HicB family antitoxin [Dehalococcoidia bacterium]
MGDRPAGVLRSRAMRGMGRLLAGSGPVQPPECDNATIRRTTGRLARRLHMTTQKFDVVLEWDADESLWVTQVPALDHLSTYGDTREEALANTREAIAGYLEAAAQEGITIPDIVSRPELLDLEVALP